MLFRTLFFYLDFLNERLESNFFSDESIVESVIVDQSLICHYPEVFHLLFAWKMFELAEAVAFAIFSA